MFFRAPKLISTNQTILNYRKQMGLDVVKPSLSDSTKLLFVGDSDSDKNALLSCFLDKDCSEEVPQFYETILNQMNVGIWQIPSKHKLLFAQFSTNVNGIVILVDLTDPNGLDNIKNHWLQLAVVTALPIVLIGPTSTSKTRAITTDEAQRFAKENKTAYFEVDHKDKKNAKIIFNQSICYIKNTRKIESITISQSETPENQWVKLGLYSMPIVIVGTALAVMLATVSPWAFFLLTIPLGLIAYGKYQAKEKNKLSMANQEKAIQEKSDAQRAENLYGNILELLNDSLKESPKSLCESLKQEDSFFVVNGKSDSSDDLSDNDSMSDNEDDREPSFHRIPTPSKG